MTKSGKEGASDQAKEGAFRSGQAPRPQEGPKAASSWETVLTPPADHTERLRRAAHERLDRLFDEAISARFYGRIALEVSFENGRPLVLHRHIEGVDKEAEAGARPGWLAKCKLPERVCQGHPEGWPPALASAMA